MKKHLDKNKLSNVESYKLNLTESQHNLLQTLNLPVICLDNNYTIRYSSPAFNHLFRVKQAEGKKLSDFALASTFQTKVTKLVEESQVFDMDQFTLHTPVSRRFFRVQGMPLVDTNLFLISLMLLKEEENTIALEAENERSEYERMADLMPAKVTANNAQGKPVYFNKAWCEFTGLSGEELKQHKWEERIHPEDLPALLQAWNPSWTTVEVQEAEFRIRNRYGKYIWQHTRNFPVVGADGSIRKWITTTHDIQHLKEEEEARAAFLKLVSHELKTPVTSIKGYVQMLLKLVQNTELNSIPQQPLKPSLERIDIQVNRLTGLIKRLLDLSRIEQGRLLLHKEDFNLNSLVEDSVADLRLINSNCQIKITHSTTCWVHGDRHKLEQVLQKLIGNAVKYSPASQEIEVEVREHKPGYAAVCVRDHGIGIEERDQKKIFERFYRSPKSSEDTYAGLGIGLFLAREIVERHNGEILLKSIPDEGSEFMMCLPCLEK